MCKPFRKGFWAASLAAAFIFVSMPALAADLECTVPFTFTANGRTLPPGAYHVSQLRSGALFVRGPRGGAFAPATPVVHGDRADWALVFHKYDDQYFLRQAWMGGAGVQLGESAEEREVVEARLRTGVATPVARIEVPRD